METRTTEPSGLLLVDKPAGITSHDVVAIVRRAVHSRRVGHAGTLDPFATGLLVILVGKGTRLIPYIDGEPKVYDAVIRFGQETDTDDVTGNVTRQAPLPDDAAIAEGVARLTGSIAQTPPSYSAKQVGGVRAYAAARRGTPLALEPVRITVHGWTLTGRAGADLHATISCSAGTYVRALARDLGRLAGSAAHLTELRRVSSGAFSVDAAEPLGDVQSAPPSLLPLADAVANLPRRRLDASELARVLHGNAIQSPADSAAAAERVALVDDEDTLIAVADRSGNELRPRVVLRDA